MSGIMRLDLRGLSTDQALTRLTGFLEQNRATVAAVSLANEDAVSEAGNCLQSFGYIIEEYESSANWLILGRKPESPTALVWYDGANWQVVSEEDDEGGDDEPIIDLLNPVEDEQVIEEETILEDDYPELPEENLLEPATEAALEAALAPDNTVIMVGSRFMGQGDEILGSRLATAFFDTLAALGRPPRLMAFYNSGVFLSTHDSTALEAIKDLATQGTEVISCGVCLEYYQLKNQLKVGRIGNMYEIINAQRTAEGVIRL